MSATLPAQGVVLWAASRNSFAWIVDPSDSRWIWANLACPAEIRLQRQAMALAVLQVRLLQHYFRLDALERRLSELRARKKPGARIAIRLIEMERKRLGSELHTSVGQMLASIRLQLELIRSQNPELPASVSQGLDQISGLASGALEQVRSVSRGLHPPEWQRLPLDEALRQLWNFSGIPQKYRAKLLFDALPPALHLESKVLIYRTAQEALSNLIRHSQATEVDLTLQRRNRHLTLIIEDNGVGFDIAGWSSAPASLSSGIGLRGIREQVEAIGGKFLVESSAKGTKLEISVPFSEAET